MGKEETQARKRSSRSCVRLMPDSAGNAGCGGVADGKFLVQKLRIRFSLKV